MCFGFNEFCEDRGNLAIGSEGSPAAKKGGGLDLEDWTMLRGHYVECFLKRSWAGIVLVGDRRDPARGG